MFWSLTLPHLLPFPLSDASTLICKLETLLKKMFPVSFLPAKEQLHSSSTEAAGKLQLQNVENDLPIMCAESKWIQRQKLASGLVFLGKYLSWMKESLDACRKADFLTVFNETSVLRELHLVEAEHVSHKKRKYCSEWVSEVWFKTCYSRKDSLSGFFVIQDTQHSPGRWEKALLSPFL